MAIADGTQFQPVWLKCLVSDSYKNDEAFVRIENGASEPPAFYVSKTLVEPKPQRDRQDVPGKVRVTLLHRMNGSSLVDVPGEPIAAGPRLEVPSRLVEL